MSCPPLYILKDKNIVTSDLCFLPDTDAGKLKLLSAYRSGSAEFDLWDLKSRRVEQGVQSDKPCNLLSIGCSNGNIVTLDKNGWLKAYDNNTIKNFVKLGIGESVGFCKASLLHASDLVAVPGCAKSSVTIWNIKDSQIVSRLVPGEKYQKLGMVMCVKLLQNNLVVGYENGDLLVWDLVQNFVVYHVEEVFKKEPVMTMDANQVNDTIECFCGSVSSSMVRVRVDLKNNSHHTKIIKLINDGLNCLKVRSDNKLLVTGGWDHKVRIWGTKKVSMLAVFDYHKDSISAVNFSEKTHNDKMLLGCASNDFKITVYDVYN